MGLPCSLQRLYGPLEPWFNKTWPLWIRGTAILHLPVYEAGPCGFWLHDRLTEDGIEIERGGITQMAEKGERKMKRLLVLAMGLILLAGCASPQIQGVLVPKEYVSQFEVSPLDKDALRWVRPGYNFAKYNKVMVDYVVFALAPDSNYKGIDAVEMKKLADAASKALVDALKEKHPVVSEPGPDVGRIKFAITDLSPSRPAVSAVSSVVPAAIGINIIEKAVTGEWAGSGMTKAEVLVLDSMTNEVIAAGYGNYSATMTGRYTKWGQVEDAFKHWAADLSKTWDNLVGKK
jgi:hypothetical protein